MKISDPDKKRWGWGITVNRSGDGDTGVNNVLFWYAFAQRVIVEGQAGRPRAGRAVKG
ncbi:MAG TPA: hypothetical protein VGL23_03655 [Chloroflexota bacterium]